MLDYVNWYLVELERKLRGRRSAQSTADLLLETRSHLEERVTDLTAKGIDPVTAARAAITDFGDPASVVYAYTRPVDMPRKAPIWAVLLITLGVAAIVPFGPTFWYIVGLPNGFPGPPSAALGLMFVTGVGLVVLSAITRRFVVLPAIVVSFVVATAFTSWLASSTMDLDAKSVSGKYGPLVILASAIVREKEMRLDWLKHYESDFAALQKWREHRTPENLAPLMGSRYMAPYRTNYGGSVIDALPSLPQLYDSSGYLVYDEQANSYGPNGRLSGSTGNGSITTRSYNPYVAPSFNLRSTYSKPAAESLWKDSADDYAVWLKNGRTLIEQDLRILDTATYGNVTTRWKGLAPGPFALAAFLSVAGAVINGLVILLMALKDRWRRNAWRRQIA